MGNTRRQLTHRSEFRSLPKLLGHSGQIRGLNLQLLERPLKMLVRLSQLPFRQLAFADLTDVALDYGAGTSQIGVAHKFNLPVMTRPSFKRQVLVTDVALLFQLNKS